MTREQFEQQVILKSKQGMSISQIARHFRTSDARVTRVLVREDKRKRDDSKIPAK